ncbi:unnamed protein product [Sphagnum compactum]
MQMAQLQGSTDGDILLKMESGVMPIGEDRSPFMIPVPSNQKRHHQIINTDFAGDARGAGNGGVWTAVAAEGKKGKYKDKRIRCDCCTIQRYILALVIFSFIAWVAYKVLTSDE